MNQKIARVCRHGVVIGVKNWLDYLWGEGRGKFNVFCCKQSKNWKFYLHGEGEKGRGASGRKRVLMLRTNRGTNNSVKINVIDKKKY